MDFWDSLSADRKRRCELVADQLEVSWSRLNEMRPADQYVVAKTQSKWDAATEPPEELVHIATTVASCSPRRKSCAKSNRGVVIYRPGYLVGEAEVLAVSRNAPPVPFRCDGSSQCREACNRVAVHAEESALLKCGYYYAHGSELVHVKTVNGSLVPSGDPSCWQCSRMMVDVGIRKIWLFQKDGWRSWSAEAFHSDTLAACGLPRCGR